MILKPDFTTAIKVSVTATHVGFASTMAAGQTWMFVSSTNCWLKQSSPTGTITCTTFANMADTDYMTINDGTTSVLYEFDKAGDGVTGGRVQVDISAVTTAAQIASLLKTAIEANQSYITVTDNGDGTLSLSSTSKNITLTDNVANGAFTVTYGPQASAASGSLFVPALMPIVLDPRCGSNLSVIRDTADGSASLVSCITF